MSQALMADLIQDQAPGYRWAPEEYLRAHEAGFFTGRVELLDGVVVPVAIGRWHGRTMFEVGARLRMRGVEVTGATLPSGSSLPDPDVWVLRDDAEPVRNLGVAVQIGVWDSADVLLVVEVSDETVHTDLRFKANLYSSSGYSEYWVVTQDVVYAHRSPSAEGYASRQEYRAGDELPVPYAPGVVIPVAELLGSPEPGVTVQQ